MEGVKIGNIKIPAIKGDSGEIVGLNIVMLQPNDMPTIENTGTTSEAVIKLGIPVGKYIKSAGIVEENGMAKIKFTFTDDTEISTDGDLYSDDIIEYRIQSATNMINALIKNFEDTYDEKIADLDTHVETKTTEFNTNAQTKTAEFNQTVSGTVQQVTAEGTRQKGILDKEASDKISEIQAINNTLTPRVQALENNKANKNEVYNKTEIDNKLENLNKYELNTNKTSTITETSTNEQYPSAKAVYDYIQSLDGSEVSY